ncbi:hypothetical protein [Dongshaea marina]|uniref:hypothetical protein n=1 Tax=Dongshaea marina TaxID=2047966 RepID=UPI000D3E301E|nr:hypothetical protein [Dongshaea marina]
MKETRYVFLTKDDVTVPQSLEDTDAGEILISLLRQGFTLSPYQVMATDAKDAIAISEFKKSGQLRQDNGLRWLGRNPTLITS